MISCVVAVGCQSPDATLGVFDVSPEASSTGDLPAEVDGTTMGFETESTGEDTTGELLDCIVEERFEGEVLESAWEDFGSLPLEHTGTMLRIALIEGEGLNIGGVRRSDPFEPSVVTVALGRAPNPESNAALQVELSTAGTTVMLKISGGSVSLFVVEGPDVTSLGTELPHDVAEHDHVRFVLEPTALAVDRSAGGGSWEPIWSGSQPLSLASGELTSSLSGRTTELTTEPGIVAFDAFSICPLP
jgi:hypothetical protein